MPEAAAALGFRRALERGGAKQVKLLYDPLRVYEVRGVFEAGMLSDRVNGPSLFRIRQAQVQVAVGAPVFRVGETPPAAAGKP